jgi:uncharacterized protein DUF5650
MWSRDDMREQNPARRTVGAIVTIAVGAATVVGATTLTLGHPSANAAPAAVGDVTTTIDIVGPESSGAFGDQVLVLSNGNFVVADPLFDVPGAADVGAVRLYDGATHALISTLTGSTAGDQVGWNYQHGRIGAVEVGDSNFVVLSKFWHNGAIADAGAVTWVNGSIGLNGSVSDTNSIVGASANDAVGRNPVVVLENATTWCARTCGTTSGSPTRVRSRGATATHRRRGSSDRATAWSASRPRIASATSSFL